MVMSGVREMTPSRGDKKSGRAGSRSECYRQNDTEI